MSATELAAVVRTRWRLVVASVVLLVLASAAVALVVPRYSTSTARVEITAHDPSLDYRNRYYYGYVVPGRPNPFIEMFSGPEAGREAAARLASPESADDVSDRLSATLVAGVSRFVIEVSARSAEPREASRLADAASGALVDKVNRIQASAPPWEPASWARASLVDPASEVGVQEPDLGIAMGVGTVLGLACGVGAALLVHRRSTVGAGATGDPSGSVARRVGGRLHSLRDQGGDGDGR